MLYNYSARNGGNINMKRRLRSLAAVLMAVVLSGAFAAIGCITTAAAKNQLPYSIMVNRKMNTVTVYTLDEKGNYTVPYKAMICSTGRPGHATPLGNFTVTGSKREWCLMVDGTYGQYTTQFYGSYLFHSICYTDPDSSTMIPEEYNMLGSAASRGCVRLQTEDAKWIYDNCAAGTRVPIYDSDDPGPLGKPERLVDTIPDDCGWDPTDPRPGNPWTQKPVEEILLSAQAASLTAGDALTLTAACLPEDAGIQTVIWESDAPDIASVQKGRVVALREGTATITASCGQTSASCTVTVTGSLLPFTDLIAGAWYYSDMRFAAAEGVLNGVGQGRMDPGGPVTWAAALQIVYNLAGCPQAETPQEGWYGTALAWAEEHGLLDGMAFEAGDPVEREEMATLLYRCLPEFGPIPKECDALDVLADADGVSGYAKDAVRWAVGAGILKGDKAQRLDPHASLTRAQAAAVVRRYLQLRQPEI